MATTMTLAQLRTAIRQRADMESTQFITDVELNSYINQSYFELYDILVQKYGSDYYVAPPYQFVTDGTTQLYPLPTSPGFYKLLGVDLSLNGSPNSFITLKPFNFSARNKNIAPNVQSFYGFGNIQYRLNGNKLWFNLVPAGGQTVQLWYVPTLTTLSADADTADGISGWTEYIIVDCVIKCLQKEESDVIVPVTQKAALLKRIESAAENRDAGSPATVGDTSLIDSYSADGYGFGYGGAF